MKVPSHIPFGSVLAPYKSNLSLKSTIKLLENDLPLKKTSTWQKRPIMYLMCVFMM